MVRPTVLTVTVKKKRQVSSNTLSLPLLEDFQFKCIICSHGENHLLQFEVLLLYFSHMTYTLMTIFHCFI